MGPCKVGGGDGGGSGVFSLQALSEPVRGLHGGWQHPATSGGASGLLQSTMGVGMAQTAPAGLGQQRSLGGQPSADTGVACVPASAVAAQQLHAQQHCQQQHWQSQPAGAAAAGAPPPSLLLELMARQVLQEQQAALQAQQPAWEPPPFVIEHPDIQSLATMHPSLAGQIRQLSQQLQVVQAQLAVALPAASQQQPQTQHPTLQRGQPTWQPQQQQQTQQQQSPGGAFTAKDVLAAFAAGKQQSGQPLGAAPGQLALPAQLHQLLERAGWSPPPQSTFMPGTSSGGGGSFAAASALDPDPCSLLEHLSAALQAAGGSESLPQPYAPGAPSVQDMIALLSSAGSLGYQLQV